MLQFYFSNRWATCTLLYTQHNIRDWIDIKCTTTRLVNEEMKNLVHRLSRTISNATTTTLKLLYRLVDAHSFLFRVELNDNQRSKWFINLFLFSSVSRISAFWVYTLFFRYLHIRSKENVRLEFLKISQCFFFLISLEPRKDFQAKKIINQFWLNWGSTIWLIK